MSEKQGWTNQASGSRVNSIVRGGGGGGERGWRGGAVGYAEECIGNWQVGDRVQLLSLLLFAISGGKASDDSDNVK